MPGEPGIAFSLSLKTILKCKLFHPVVGKRFFISLPYFLSVIPRIRETVVVTATKTFAAAPT